MHREQYQQYEHLLIQLMTSLFYLHKKQKQKNDNENQRPQQQ